VGADSQEDFKMYFKSELKRFNDIAKQSNIQAE
jgi:hypothetical protein